MVTVAGYPGGKREKAALDVWKERPEALLEEAVWGMLPRNKLRKEFMRRLRIFPDEEHPLDFIPPGQVRARIPVRDRSCPIRDESNRSLFQVTINVPSPARAAKAFRDWLVLQGKGELSEVRLVTSRQQGEERHAILDRNTPWFWLRRHR